MYEKTLIEVKKLLPNIDVERRFIPFFMVHEFEALLFSDIDILVNKLGLESKKEDIEKVMKSFNGNPELINNNINTAPSKRIAKWKPTFKKTVDGIDIAEAIGLTMMRQKCCLFDAWMKKLESLN